MRERLLAALLAGLLVACNGSGSDDFDGDSWDDHRDCDPANAQVYPGAPDPIDATRIDNNCDGIDGVDGDGDGWAANAVPPDCNDANVGVFPGAPDVVDGEGLDNDCDGVDGVDGDGDGAASETSGGADCDDTDDAIRPGAIDIADDGVDQDCDGADRICDADGDGVLLPSCGGGDCDDGNATRYEGATESCNGLDDDCDGAVPAVESDSDGDGVATCGGDCDDFDSQSAPGIPEVCDGVDNDCNGALGVSEIDVDGDGYLACAECDDGEVDRHPDADELCNAIDDDCDGAVPADEGDADQDGSLTCADCDDADAALEALDTDGDGVSTCAGDCDDTDAGTYPGAGDFPFDGVDSDCSGIDGVDADGDGFAGLQFSGSLPPALQVLLDCDDADPLLNLADADADGSTTCAGDCDDGDASVEGLDADGDGSTTCDGDCDDADPAVAPGLTEICDGVDTDCDGTLPPADADGDGDGDWACNDCDDADATVTTLDVDGDGQTTCDGDCDDTNAMLTTLDADADGWTSCAGDCSDYNAGVNPSVPELCNAVDDDCDGVLPAIEVDGDGDGFIACADCDDGAPLRYPGAPELCDGLDNDCDAAVSGDELDGDGDGYVECQPWVGAAGTAGGDCNDLLANVYLGAPDGCDNLDNDCNGIIDDFLDLDGDGFCLGDCDDTDPVIFPGTWLDASTDATVNPPGDADCDGGSGATVGASRFRVVGPRFFGADVASGGDLNGDGYDEVVVWGEYSSNPAIYVYSGADLVQQDWFLGAELGAADATATWGAPSLSGPREAPLCIAPDVDGDGYDELLFGRCMYWGGPIGPGSFPSFCVAGASNSLGSRGACGGDIDGDGKVELVLGETGAGRAWLFWGSSLITEPTSTAQADLQFQGDATMSEFGYDAEFLGDVDGDGVEDLGVAWANGLVIYSGASLPVSGVLVPSDGVAIVQGYNRATEGGLLAAGDVDGDGYADFIVCGLWGCYLMSGQVAISSASPSLLADGVVLGSSYANPSHSAVADFDADGTLDVVRPQGLVGNSQSVLVYSGAQIAADMAAGLTPTYDFGFSSGSLGAQFANSITAGDWNGDGAPDLIIAASSYNSTTEPGYVFFLPNTLSW